mgnify:CR=1 FL=1|tara:strand:- start:244 stop:552 length:309 start_codon:yes stop_codon:yes gene_type:complete
MLNNNKIINLINKNKWDDILENLKKNKIKKNDKVLNGKNIIHIATLNNRKVIIDYILKSDHEILSKIDNDGNSCFHSDCIIKWFKQGNISCPICRESLLKLN